MILSEQLPVQPGDVIDWHGFRVIVTGTDEEFVFYRLVPEGRADQHRQLKQAKFHAEIAELPDAVLTRAEPVGVEG